MILIAALLLAAQDPVKPPPSDAPVASTSTTRQCTPSSAPPSRRIAQLLASATGASAATAYRVRNIGEEYQILDALGLCPQMQALTMPNNHPYDVLTGVDPRTGESRDLWFDIASFFGHEF
jgi:hypothetical protein